MTREAVLVFGGLLFWLGGANPSLAEDAHVVVKVVTETGLPSPKGRLTVTDRTGSVVADREVLGADSLNLPYGKYRFRFDEPFSEDVERLVDVNQSQILVVLAARRADFVLDMKRVSVAVTVRTSRSKSCTDDASLWVRLSGVFLQVALERELKAAGAAGVALFDAIDASTYIATVVDGTKVVGTTVVDTRGPVTMAEVTLDACTPPR